MNDYNVNPVHDAQERAWWLMVSAGIFYPVPGISYI